LYTLDPNTALRQLNGDRGVKYTCCKQQQTIDIKQKSPLLTSSGPQISPSVIWSTSLTPFFQLHNYIKDRDQPTQITLKKEMQVYSFFLSVSFFKHLRIIYTVWCRTGRSWR